MAAQMNTEGWTNLHLAVAGRFINLILSLLEQNNGMVNIQDEQGRTPLHLVCSGVGEPEDLSSKTPSDTEQIITLLLSNGADTEILDNSGKSPIHCLVHHWLSKQFPLGEVGNKIITQFIQCGADINGKDRNGRTPLHYVAGSTEVEVPVVKTHQEEEEMNPRRRNQNLADIEIRRNLLLNILRHEQQEMRMRDIHPRIRELAEHGLLLALPEPGQRDNEPGQGDNEPERSSNEESKLNVNLPYVKEFTLLLLSSGADVNASDNNGNTPLHFAIAAKRFDLFKEIMKGKVNVNIKNDEGQTLLHHAVSCKEKFDHCGVLLLHDGALASIADIKGRTPLDIAKNRNLFYDFLKHLILLISVKLHPCMSIQTNNPREEEFKKMCEKECKDLNTYFELHGRSQLPLLLRYNCLPTYTKNGFFQTIMNQSDFTSRFPNYYSFLKNKFSHDQKRIKMIEQCTEVFSCFGGRIHYNEVGRLVYTRNSHWESLPKELKSQILSYLSTEELEYLSKHLIQ